MNTKRVLITLVIAIAIATLPACSGSGKQGLATGDITKDNLPQVSEVLKEAGLSNVDVFEEWVKNADSLSTDSNLGSEGFSDADCRMTVMLLAGDAIEYESVKEDYNGTYLMFDLDAIDHDERFQVLKDKRALFTTMFGEMPFAEGDYAQSLGETWDKYGIRVQSDKWSVISLLFQAYEQEEAFVGHTGILIDVSDNTAINSPYVFVEKIGFGEPFRLTLVKDETELIEMLAARGDYDTLEGEASPIVYRNNEKIGELH